MTHPAGFVGSPNLVWTARSKGTAASPNHKSILLIQVYNMVNTEQIGVKKIIARCFSHQH